MNVYATLPELQTRPGISDATDADLSIVLEAVSREIDGFCERHFFVEQATKYFATDWSLSLQIPDVLVVDTLKVDTDRDFSYSETWTEDTHFVLEDNRWPKSKVQIIPNSDKAFVSYATRYVEIIGTWGYGDGLSASPWLVTAITGTVADVAGTTLTLSAEGTIVAGHTIKIGSEQMYVSAVTSDDSKTATVERGVNGTTATAQAGAAISTAKYPPRAKNACLMLATADWNMRGSGDIRRERIGNYTYDRAPLISSGGGTGVLSRDLQLRQMLGTLKRYRVF